jgi:D-alanine-D-alanine ligase
MSTKKKVAILCGGATYEHEVSIISGIQIAQHIDRTKYQPIFLYFDKNNQIFLIKDFSTNKQDFLGNKRILVDLVAREGKLGIKPQSRFGTELTADIAYLAFHGGTGESGPAQGLLELFNVPFTGPGQEGAVLTMNKAVTKEVLMQANIPVLPWVSVKSSDYELDKAGTQKKILEILSLPLIIKPVHLGSSIGIVIVTTELELEQQLALAARTDSEILLEPALRDFTEFNVSVRSNQGRVECSPIEEPKREGEVLSFDDKYANGGKKGAGGGMELLDRTVPADISAELAAEIINLATKVYQACRLAGLLRIDFMYSAGELYCTEVNPIPGSLSFYLWEPAGETFEQQITQALEDAADRHSKQILVEPYQTDIVEKFIA